ncbi:MAG: glutamine-hydrolyzing carbamoyl-phosphate synthase small subunit [Marinilabiliaceae bacterium]|nr:glutamine-hydrolyzing carbamoyl-phosphate synthase small subunit [Marinilabiliaceae bacterium]
MPELKKIKLILEDGTVFEGTSFGCHKSVAGEVVFNTAMTGYPESLTDPSYKGQILVTTYPLIGNYGVPVDDVDEYGLPKFFESDRIHLSGLIISDYSFEYSHWNAQKSLSQWLQEQGVPGIFGIDTRALTKKLRETGTMLGKIEVEGQPVDFYNPDKENQVAKASTPKKEVYGNGKHKVVLVDCGCKYNIIRCLLKRDTTVIRVPWDYDFTQEDYDGVMISNGPGDPQYCQPTVANIRKAFDQGKPIFGICMGNQLIGIASGAKTYKLKYGHRAHNHPVRKINDTKCFITSQNHSFAIDNATLSSDWEPLFVNINDDTNEGIQHKTKPIFSAQFHPEAFSGPTDTEFLFDDFVKMIEEHKAKN